MGSSFELTKMIIYKENNIRVLDMITEIENDNLDERILAPIFNMEDEDGESGVATINKVKTKRPRRFKVLIHNDDYTTMEFVIYVLQKHFRKSMSDAEQVMMKVHNEGVGICGVYTCEIAESKVANVTKDAKDNGHPLLCSSEPE
jgi:ATP-dependent Clp protease adaptor protein ClpS